MTTPKHTITTTRTNYYHRPLHRASKYYPDTSGRYWTQAIDVEPQPRWVPLLLMPLRLIVAMFLHIEQAIKPNIDADRFGYMFRNAPEQPKPAQTIQTDVSVRMDVDVYGELPKKGDEG